MKETNCEDCMAYTKKELALAKTDNFYAYLDIKGKTFLSIFLKAHNHIVVENLTGPQWQEFGFFLVALEKAYKKTFDKSYARGMGAGSRHFSCQIFTLGANKLIAYNKEINDYLQHDNEYCECCESRDDSIAVEIKVKIFKELKGKLDVSHLPGGEIVNKE